MMSPGTTKVFGIETQEPEQTQTLSSGHELQTGGGNGLTSQRLLAILQVSTCNRACPQLPEMCENTLGQTSQIDRASFFAWRERS